MRRIICIGNQLVAEDSAGPQMYRLLQGEPWPADVELIDGGLRGLDLLPFFDGAELVVLIDQVSGFCPPPGVILLQGDELLRATEKRFDHQAGIGYLLRLLPQVCEEQLPVLRMIGIEGCLDEKSQQSCRRLLRRLLELPADQIRRP